MLFKTAAIDYDLKNNYNLTETFTKTNSLTKTLTGNANQSGTTVDNSTVNNSINRESDVNVIGEKSNTLNSTTSHAETNDLTHENTTSETRQTDDKKVSSDTPNGLLAMVDITTNVYASKAEIDGQTATSEKTDNFIENTIKSVTDTVTAESADNSNDTTHEDTNESSNSSTVANGTFNNETLTTQNENGSGNETYTLERVGDIGVDTTPDKLKKHVEFQKIVTTAYTQFFNECEDLFMQIF
jgi:hypothetical protein